MTAPTITGLITSVTFGENTVNAAPQIIDNDVTVTDPEGNFDGGALTVAGHFGGDSVSINNQGTGAGQIGFSEGNVSFGGTVIGTATGGAAGARFVVTFNANATTAAVEAVVENLTYANSNNVNPAASRTLKIVLTDAAGEGDFVVQTGTANPLNVGIGFDAKPAFGDLDGDGDLDLVAGRSFGDFLYFKNTGTASAPVFVEQTGAANPLNGFDVGSGSVPALVDIDGDGDLDVVATENDGVVNYFKNTGTASAPVFAEQTGAASPFNGIVPTNFTKPAFADVDGDGDKDMLLGTHGGTLLYYKNTGSATAPAFAQQSPAANPFAGIDTGSYTSPAFGDVDGDGDLDLLVGELGGAVSYFDNTGSGSAPSFVERTGTANPFNGIDVGNESTPALADIDGDGDLDLVVGAMSGTFTVALNATSRVKVNVFTENDAPVVQDLSRTTTENGTLDEDFAASDPDGTIASYAIDSQPAKGSVTMWSTSEYNADGDYYYGFLFGYVFSTDGAFESLGYGESEEVTFTYHAVDNNGTSSAPATVTIRVTGQNDAPVIGDVASSVTASETAVTIIDTDITITDPEGNFDGGTLTVSGLLAEDIVSVNNQGTGAGQVGFSGGAITYGGVAIGTATAGAGANLVVTFNQNATTAAVEAVTENLTYANGSDAPTASHDLTITLADETQSKTPILDAHTGAANPIAGIDHGDWNAAAFGDLDGDGDLDLVVGETYGALYFHENTGSASSPSFSEVTGAANPFAGIDLGKYSSPALVDLDGDGDLDLVAGAEDGTLSYFENTGSASAPAYTARTGAANPFDGVNVGDKSTPSFSDLDGDGDLDLATGKKPGDAGSDSIRYFENTGTATDPGFTARTGDDNPFKDVRFAGSLAAPSLGDFDGDGDVDLIVGTQFHGAKYFANVGSAASPIYAEQTSTANPFVGVVAGPQTAPGEIRSTDLAPTFVDLDGDGDLDVAVGNVVDGLGYVENIGIGVGTSTTVTVNVTDVNDAPVAADDARSTNEDTVVTGTAPTSDVDGTVVSHALVSGVAKGSLTFLQDGSYSFDPDGHFDDLDAGESEQVPFTYRATDNNGGQSDVKTVTITVNGVDAANVAPVAEDDGHVTGEDSILNSAVPPATDSDGTIDHYALDADVSKGALTFNADGTFDFDPNGEFESLGTGEDEEVTFTYHAIDNDGAASETKTVTITVNGVDAANVAPVASDSSKSTGENTTLNSAVPAATDSDGTIAGYALVSDVAKGDLTFNSDGTYSFDPDGAFEDLDAGDQEQVTFTYRAVDNDGGQSAAKTVTITVNGANEAGGGTTNDVPKMTSGIAFTVAENTTAVGTIIASDGDDAPVYSIAGGADAFLFKIDAKTGALSFKAAPDFEKPGDSDGNNIYQVTVRASDGDASDTETLTVTVGNEDGVDIKGSKKKDKVSDSTTVKGQSMATNEEDTIIGKGKNDKLDGAGGNDLLNGGKGKDKLFGDDGDDRLVGGKQVDKLTGGAGEDSFVFDKKLTDNIDKVKDFQSGIDSFVLDDKVFKKLSPGPLSVEEFVVGKKAKDGDDHIIYNQKKGQLLYDKDGKGGADAFVFAKVAKAPDLDAGDFLVI